MYTQLCFCLQHGKQTVGLVRTCDICDACRSNETGLVVLCALACCCPVWIAAIVDLLLADTVGQEHEAGNGDRSRCAGRFHPPSGPV